MNAVKYMTSFVTEVQLAATDLQYVLNQYAEL